MPKDTPAALRATGFATYEYALGSVEESRAWYQLARRRLAENSLSYRLKRLDSMRRLLLVMIANERRGGEWNHRRS